MSFRFSMKYRNLFNIEFRDLSLQWREEQTITELHFEIEVEGDNPNDMQTEKIVFPKIYINFPC